MNPLKLSDFDYSLPKELIAQYPLKARDTCRLLVLNRMRGTIEHRSFVDIADYVQSPDLLVTNDTKVVPCRLKGRRVTGGAVEVFLLKHRGNMHFDAMLKPGRLKDEERVSFDGGLTGIISGRDGIRFEAADIAQVYKAGRVPLPPYIKRDAEPADTQDYQTVYARAEGAVAAPTAGLHFTGRLLARLESNGVQRVSVTLHVGTGTFKIVKAEDVTRHAMDEEWFSVPPDAQELIRDARAHDRRIIAVGTTSVRALETFAAGPVEGLTNIFIYPGYKFKSVNGLLTNFHLPRTTLFMLVCAFAGTEFIKTAYAEAIQQNYRFYSYGDAMLIL